MSASPHPDASIAMEYQQQKARSDEVDREAIFGVLAAVTIDGQMDPFFDVVRHWLSKSPSANCAHAQYSCMEALCASLVSWKREAPWSMHVLAPIWADALVPWVGQYCALFAYPPEDGPGAYLSQKIFSYLSVFLRQVTLDMLPMDSEEKSALTSVFALEAIPGDILKSILPAYIHAAASSLNDVAVFTAISDVLLILSNKPFGSHPRLTSLFVDVLDSGTSRSLRTLCSRNMVQLLKSGYERYDHVVVFVSLCGSGSCLWRRTFMAHNVMSDMMAATKRFLRSLERQEATSQSQSNGARSIRCFLCFIQDLTTYEGLRGVMDALKCNIIYLLLKCDAVLGTSFIGNDPDAGRFAVDTIFGNIRNYMVHPAVLSLVARARYHKSRPVSSRLIASCSRRTQFHWYSMMVREVPELEMAVSKMLEETPTFYRECAYPGCPSLYETAPTKCCLGCRQVFYHSEACQRADWRNHRDACLLAAEQFLDGAFPSLSKHWKNCFHWFFRYELLNGPRSAECKKLWHHIADQPDIGGNDIMIVLDYSTNEKKIDVIASPYVASELKEPRVLMRWYVPWHSGDRSQRTFGEASFPISKAEGWNSDCEKCCTREHNA